jgi:hypothetical protein
MYKPSKIKHPSVGNHGKNKKGEPAYASSGTAPTLPAAPESSRTYATPEAETQDRPIPRVDTPAEETRKPVVNEDEQKKIVNQPASTTAPAYDNSEES